MLGVSYWIFPIVSSLCWLGMLLGLLIHWTSTGKPHYPSMAYDQSIAYISDVGAEDLKPLFIAGACVTTVFLDLSFASEIWLRHRGRLVRNVTRTEKVLAGLSIVFALAGTAGLILLSIFDTLRHPNLHDGFLLLFIVGYVVSAVFICWEYQRLGIKNRQHRVLRTSFWLKLTFILVEVALAIAFATCNFVDRKNVAAVLEWAIAFIFTFYVFSFFVDLLPAVKTKSKAARFGTGAAETELQLEENDGAASERTVGRNYQKTTSGGKSPGGLSGNF
ncbi:Protein sfk1 [Lachnellula suecica]|uniref:Protein sfk1 n=1 Tax=Lachnellula suecica TaxID=602035 RepID=A0A8T9BTI4_9HELO|nr:Protein sfk1 [Lachnellula suecica]